MPSVTRGDWPRYGDYVIARRVTLGMTTQLQLARASGVSDRTISQVEFGRSVRLSTVAAIDSALQWQPGSGRRILAGGEPEPVPGSPGAQQPEADSRPEALRDIVTADDWDDERIQELWELKTMPLDTKRGMIIYYLRGKENSREAEVRPLRQAR